MPSTSLNITGSRNCAGSAAIARRTSSSTMRSKKVPCGSSSWSSSNTENGSIASMSTVSGCRVRRRYSLMKACRRIVSNHPLAFVPRSNWRSEEHTSELQSHSDLVCRLLLEKKKEEHILRCLGAAVIMEWNDLPTQIERELFQHATF